MMVRKKIGMVLFTLILSITACGKEAEETAAESEGIEMEESSAAVQISDYSEEGISTGTMQDTDTVETEESSTPAYKMAQVPSTEYSFVFALLFDDSYVLDDWGISDIHVYYEGTEEKAGKVNWVDGEAMLDSGEKYYGHYYQERFFTLLVSLDAALTMDDIDLQIDIVDFDDNYSHAIISLEENAALNELPINQPVVYQGTLFEVGGLYALYAGKNSEAGGGENVNYTGSEVLCINCTVEELVAAFKETEFCFVDNTLNEVALPDGYLPYIDFIDNGKNTLLRLGFEWEGTRRETEEPATYELHLKYKNSSGADIILRNGEWHD